jgi:hypothetical protein
MKIVLNEHEFQLTSTYFVSQTYLETYKILFQRIFI